MTQGILLLAATAAGIGVVHTLLGPDHFLPFVVLSRARRWSRSRTRAITAACGLAHVGSSLVHGLGGIALGVAVQHLTHIETVRGSMASWGLIIVGTIYGAWGLHRALRGERHVHAHPEPTLHAHAHHRGHDHRHEHAHHHPPAPSTATAAAAGRSQDWRTLTPWVLFVVFVLGPCEPLIPLVMIPAATGNAVGVAVVAGLFTAATLLAMLAAVAVGRLGLDLLPLGRLERDTHARAGLAILVSGLGIKLLGW
jgi:ABC-type nickel/cobalt efflux system permease component RcnA